MSDPAKLIRVKFLTKHPDRDVSPHWLQFLPGNNPVLGRCHFIFDRDERNYDWIAVYDDLPSSQGERHSLWEEVLACPRERTLLLTSEPATVKVYGHGFLNQFGWVLTSQEPWVIRHPGAIYCQTGLIRFYVGPHDHIAQHPPTNKTALISTVCSSKQQSHTLHKYRYQFTQQLKQALPELEIFGHGVRYIEHKNEALDSFRYHVAIENHVCQHHWTEKLADSFLGMCLPFITAHRMRRIISRRKVSSRSISTTSRKASPASSRRFGITNMSVACPPSAKRAGWCWSDTERFRSSRA